MSTSPAPLVCLLTLLAACSPGKQTDEPLADPGAGLSVLSYNVNYGLAGDSEALTAIVDADAAIVLLQETTPEWEAALRGSSAITETWPHMQFHHCCGAGGLAILSRWPITTFEVLEPPGLADAWFPAARAVVETDEGPVELLDVHLRPPVATPEQGWVSALSSTPAVRVAEIGHYLPKLDPTLPTVIAGDLNEGDGGRAVAALREAGFVDVLAQLDVRGHTWRWGGLRGRLDHVLVDEGFVATAAEIRDAGRSDHLPVLVHLQRR